MNYYARRMIEDRARRGSNGRYIRDRRNPYGSRGGYVTSERRDRRGYEDERDMRRDRAGYAVWDDDFTHHPNDYSMDYAERDYGEHKLTEDDMNEWKHKMLNEDGTRGEHFSKDQVMSAIHSLGIEPEEVGGSKIMCLAMNMMYSDYCNVAKKFGVDRPEFYADMAKAFLKDKDFDGKPAEKLALYYYCIIEDDE